MTVQASEAVDKAASRQAVKPFLSLSWALLESLASIKLTLVGNSHSFNAPFTQSELAF